MPLIIFRINTLEKYLRYPSKQFIKHNLLMKRPGDCKNLYIYTCMSNYWSILIAAKQNRELPLQVLGVNYNLITLVLNKHSLI
jgi:hypothetical protein